MKSIYLARFHENLPEYGFKEYQVNVGDMFYAIGLADVHERYELKNFEEQCEGLIEKLYQAPTVPNWGYPHSYPDHMLTLAVYKRIK